MASAKWLPVARELGETSLMFLVHSTITPELMAGYSLHICLGARLAGAGFEPSAALMWHEEGFGMTPATIDLNGLDSDIRANVLRQLTASGLSEQLFVNQVYHALAGGQFSLLDLLGPNAGTLEAMQELAEGRGVNAENIEQLFNDLHADD